MARIPSYRHHKGSGQAFIELRGVRIYLGKHGTDKSRREYSRLLNEYLAGDNSLPPQPGTCTVTELICAFWGHVTTRYVKRGVATSEQNSFRFALRPVRRMYGEIKANDFGPLKLLAVRKALVDSGICRTRVNGHLHRIRRCWQWGVSREMVSESTWRALQSVEGLRVGEEGAIETADIPPVEIAHVDAIRPHVSPHLWAMVQFQLLTGCRPGEVCMLRMCDLKMAGEVWEYIPESHKTEHHGKQRIVFIGPRCQDVLRPFLRTETHKPIFSPRESKEWGLAQRRKNRKTPLTPSQKARRRKRNPQRRPTEQWTVSSYGHAIKAACTKAGVPEWAPNQLRHTAATIIRSVSGIENAQVILGHASLSTTEIYAQEDFKKAREVMRKLG